MGKRIKKLTVKPEQRRDWLKRYEIGESAADIAGKDGYDIRTVRRHIEQAQQERDRRDARLTVLKNALEGHYADLCRFAEKLEAQVMKEEVIALREQRLWVALKQHLPRSPLWVYFNKWDNFIEERMAVAEKTKKKVMKALEADTKMQKIASNSEGLISFLVAVLMHQMGFWSRGYEGLLLQNNMSTENVGKGLVNLKYGAYFVSNMAKDRVAAVRRLIERYEAEVKLWDEYKALVKVNDGLSRLKRDIGDEIAIITLRRVVPGKCLYCPL